MRVDPDTLSSFASEYAKDMTSIRGRRVQRLLKREFADAEYVLLAQVGSGAAAVLGLSTSGAAICATDGKGRQASVVKWSHGSTEALETHFDLYKDSLPVLSTNSLPLASCAHKFVCICQRAPFLHKLAHWQQRYARRWHEQDPHPPPPIAHHASPCGNHSSWRSRGP